MDINELFDKHTTQKGDGADYIMNRQEFIEAVAELTPIMQAGNANGELAKRNNLKMESQTIKFYNFELPELKSTTLNGCLNDFVHNTMANNDVGYVKALFCKMMNHYKYNCE